MTGSMCILDQSPLAAGSVYVLRLGLRSGGTDHGQGTNTGAGKWIGPLAEFTGLQFLGDGKSFLIHLQHRTQDSCAVPGTADELRVSGLKLP